MSGHDRIDTSRALDLAVLVVVAPAALVLGAACAVAVRLSSRGPVLFRQTRAGRDGTPFDLYKFRTMVDGPNPLVPDPSRITRAGRWLRRSSLDELPQLLNVARGEMSIVGPRPALVAQAERFDERQRRRLAVRPGLTGWAQVNGRNAIAWSERIELDLVYVERRSLALDLRILARTAATVVSGRGATGHPVDDPFARVEATPQ